MDTVGVRELKTHLSRHLRRVRAVARFVVTERGRAIATLEPVEAPADTGELIKQAAFLLGPIRAGARRSGRSGSRAAPG
jgi:antitoxin (DNA-binding transcriptional repressor) of toxin-antitoxin stability system